MESILRRRRSPKNRGWSTRGKSLRKRKRKWKRRIVDKVSPLKFSEISTKKAEYEGKVIPKTPETKAQIKKLIEKSILFQSLNKEDIGIVIDAME